MSLSSPLSNKKNSIPLISDSDPQSVRMSLRGFSGFEAMFRKKMATAAPKDLLVKKKMSEGLTKEEARRCHGSFLPSLLP